MNATEQGLLHAVATEPDDDTHRLVYADWLDDHGQEERAEFIRAQVRLVTDLADSPSRRELAYRARQLLDQHEAAWMPFAADLAVECRFSRGFVESVLLRGDQLLAFLTARALDRLPLRSLALVRLDEVAALEGLPVGNCLRRLDLTGNPLSAEDVRLLASLPALAGVRDLDLSFTFLEDDSVQALCEICKTLPLDRLHLGGNWLSARAIQLLEDVWGKTTFCFCQRDPDYLYHIQDPNDTDLFVTGTTPDFCQVFLAGTFTGAHLALFDFEGRLLQLLQRSRSDLGLNLGDDAVATWLDELRVIPGTIQVKRFRLTEHDGIRDFPRFFEDDHDADPEMYDLIRREVVWWIEEGKFVWDYYGDDFWLDRSGEVTAT